VQNRLVFSLRCTILYHILWHEYVNLNLKNVCLNLRIAGGAAICGTVHWLDLEWPPSLNRCLVRLWELYDTECSQRIKESCESSSAYYKLNL
jgi:hypothetical protein